VGRERETHTQGVNGNEGARLGTYVRCKQARKEMGGGGRERDNAPQGKQKWRRGERGSVAPEIQRLHRREARQTGGEGGGTVSSNVVLTEGEQKGQRKN
jgi:hypothetical protein